MKPQDDKDKKKKSSSNEGYSAWKKAGPGLERREKPGDWKPSETPYRMSFDKAFGAAKRSGKDSFEFKGKLYSTETTKPKVQFRKTGATPPPSKPVMNPMGTISSPIPGVTSKRTVRPPSLPNKKTAAVDMAAKKETAKPRTWKRMNKSGRPKSIEVLKALAHGATGQKLRKDATGWSAGKKIKQSTTRAVTNKRLGEKGVSETQLGGETSGKYTDRTQSGLKKQDKVKKKYQRH
jgi:hypothetical protein